MPQGRRVRRGVSGDRPISDRSGRLLAPIYAQVDFTYLVPAGSSIRSVADADRPGVRIAVVRNHAIDLALSRILKQAELVRAEIPDGHFRPAAYRTCGCIRSSPPGALAYSSQAARLAGAGGPLRGQPRSDGGPEGPSRTSSPTSASSSKRPRRRGWCNGQSSAPACAGSRWRPREIQTPRSECHGKRNQGPRTRATALIVASMAITPNHWVETDTAKESIRCRASHPERLGGLLCERV